MDMNHNHSLKGRSLMKTKELLTQTNECKNLTIRQIGQSLYDYLSLTVTHITEPIHMGKAGLFVISAQLDREPNCMMTFELVDEETFVTDPIKETVWIDDDAFVNKMLASLKLPKGKRNLDQFDVLTFRAVPDTPACQAALIELERTDHDKACAVYLVKKGKPPHSSDSLFLHTKHFVQI